MSYYDDYEDEEEHISVSQTFAHKTKCPQCGKERVDHVVTCFVSSRYYGCWNSKGFIDCPNCGRIHVK